MKFQKIKFDKETLLVYWKKGWKVWLMMLCINIAILIVALPIMIPFALLVSSLKIDMNTDIVPFIIAIIIGPPISYYMFTVFCGEQ